jgi:hypothetical protein
MRRVSASLAAAFALAAIAAPPAGADWVRDGVPVCAAAGDQTAPVLVRTGGGAFVIWEDARTTPSRIYAQRLNGSGIPLWAAGGIQVATTPGNQWKPVAVGDAVGGVIVAWVQEIDAGNHDVYAQRLDSNGVRQWAAAGIAVCAAAGVQNDLAIVSDFRQPLVQPAGAIIAWTDGRLGTDTDIYAQAIDGLGGLRWTANGVGVCVLTGIQEDPAIVTDGTGANLNAPRGVILAWRDERTGDGDIHSQRLNAAGQEQWMGNGIFVAEGPFEQRAPRLLYTGSASAVIVWEDGSGMGRSYDLYAQKVANNGVVWAAGGVPVCDVGGNQLDPTVISDAAGGMIVAWRDARDFFNPLVYLQRLDASGVGLWASGGVSASTEGQGYDPVLVSGASGSAVLGWLDSRVSSLLDVYAQKIDANGGLEWNPAGQSVCLASGQQSELVAVPDSTGGAIVAWTDRRGASADIYAQRVSGTGEVVAVAEQAAPAAYSLRVSAPEPNPSRGPVALSLDLPAAHAVTARVYDVSGRLLETIASGLELPAGQSVLRFDARALAAPGRAAAGVYFVRVEAGAAAATRRILLLD